LENGETEKRGGNDARSKSEKNFDNSDARYYTLLKKRIRLADKVHPEHTQILPMDEKNATGRCHVARGD
jgi:hypothetical protein